MQALFVNCVMHQNPSKCCPPSYCTTFPQSLVWVQYSPTGQRGLVGGPTIRSFHRKTTGAWPSPEGGLQVPPEALLTLCGCPCWAAICPHPTSPFTPNPAGLQMHTWEL